MPSQLQEWAAFIALVPYFAECPGPENMANRLLLYLRQCKDRVLTSDALLLHAGLSFFAEEVEVDLALMQLVRDHVISPVPERPFTFHLGACVLMDIQR